MRILSFATMLTCFLFAAASHPVEDMLERIQPGASDKIEIKECDSPVDFFEITAIDGKPAILGNNPVNIAAGLNWYLKYYANTHLTWNCMTADLPATLPVPAKPERRETDAKGRYYLNYCTHSYSMAFWDWERWQQEIDWMALHGINMPLAMTGIDVVWRNTLQRLGYNKDEINSFIAGPAFQAWWLMNNLEGWGGPNSDQWYRDREDLQKRILARMHEYGMKPVLPGYSGMVPHDADTRLGVKVSGKGIWNGFIRPAFLMTDDPKFDELADIYYQELTKLYGTADYYSMDPFHEGGSTEGVDLTAAGGIIAGAMKRANPDATWVIQGWSGNPRQELLDGVKKGDIVVLDLASEIRPNWGDPDTPAPYERPQGYAPHDWMYCMLLNFGGNVGLHGRMDFVIDEYYKARRSSFGKDLIGIGLTMEGIENNPVMYELMSELIWRPAQFSKEDWLKEYITARYGDYDNDIYNGWIGLANSIYNCPFGNIQQGTSESVFCARPAKNVYQVSSWSKMKHYYEPKDVIAAAGEFVKAADRFKGNENFEYDLVDIVRQAIAEKGRLVYGQMIDALNSSDSRKFDRYSAQFIDLIKSQDKLLSTRKEFKVGTWINDAHNLAPTPDERDMMEQNARLLITTWGPRQASEAGKLRDYAHREWAGVLNDLYLKRWTRWIDMQRKCLDGSEPEGIDFYAIDEQWVNSRNPYSFKSEGDAVKTAKKLYRKCLVNK